jgi:hypothetical protein
MKSSQNRKSAAEIMQGWSERDPERNPRIEPPTPISLQVSEDIVRIEEVWGKLILLQGEVHELERDSRSVSVKTALNAVFEAASAAIAKIRLAHYMARKSVR